MVLLGQTTRRVSVYVYAKDDCSFLGVADLGRLAEEVPMLEISLLKIESPRCSCTMRTARSRISGEYFGVFFLLIMASFSQELKPPQNPGRFSAA